MSRSPRKVYELSEPLTSLFLQRAPAIFEFFEFMGVQNRCTRWKMKDIAREKQCLNKCCKNYAQLVQNKCNINRKINSNWSRKRRRKIDAKNGSLLNSLNFERMYC